MVSIKEKRHCLIFEVTGKLYGVQSQLVQEIVRLPEILPMEDAPAFVIGVINLRGHVVPVVDLNIRLGRLSILSYALTDAIVILTWQGITMGILINDVREVIELTQAEIEHVPLFEEFDSRRYHFVKEVAKVGDDMVMLLDPEHLLHAIPLEVKINKQEIHEIDHDILTPRRMFNPDATPAERAVFHERAQRLIQATERGEVDGLVPLAVVQLHNECFGIDLIQVQGFAQARQVTPIPCCPDHIAGSMNLRGDILTLVDLTRILHLPSNPQAKPGKVMVARVDQWTVGVLIHDVVDVIHRRPDQIVRVPVAASGLKKEHLLGTVPYTVSLGEIMLGILNLEAILKSRELLVHETV